jgi:hypothetical protein
MMKPVSPFTIVSQGVSFPFTRSGRTSLASPVSARLVVNERRHAPARQAARNSPGPGLALEHEGEGLRRSLTTRRTHHAPYQTNPTVICRGCEGAGPTLGHSLNRPTSPRQTNPTAICRGSASRRPAQRRYQTNPTAICRGSAGRRREKWRYQTNPTAICRGYVGRRSTTSRSPNEPTGRTARRAVPVSSTRRTRRSAFPERTQLRPGVGGRVPRTNPPSVAPNEPIVPFRSVAGFTRSGGNS